MTFNDPEFRATVLAVAGAYRARGRMSRRMHCLDPGAVAVMRAPTAEGALRVCEPFRRKMGWPYPLDASPEVTALACIHKTRIRWAGSTKAMVRESKAWLVAHGMSPNAVAPANLTVQ